MCRLLSVLHRTFLVCASSASLSLSLHAPRDGPLNVLPLGCPGSFFHPFPTNIPVFLGDSTSPGDFPIQRVQVQSILTARSRQGHAAWGSAPRTAAPSPSCPRQNSTFSHGSAAASVPSCDLPLPLPDGRFYGSSGPALQTGVAPALGNDHRLSWCACQHQRPGGLQKPGRLALRGCLRQCCFLPTAWAASWESSELGLWGGHLSEGAHVAGDSISARPLVSAVPSADNLVVFLCGQVTSSAGSSPRPSQQQQTAFHARKTWQHQVAVAKTSSSSSPCHQALWGAREFSCSDNSWEQRGEALLPPSSPATVLEDPPSSASSRLEILLFYTAAHIATANSHSPAAP